jgi:hypothetical protein
MGGSTTNPGIVVCQQNFGWFYSGWSWHQPLILYSNPMRSNRLVGQEQRASEEEERFHEEDFGAQILELV